MQASSSVGHFKNTVLPADPKPKIHIKPFKVNPSLPANYFQNAFEKIQLALSALFEGKQLNYRLEDLYRTVESMCRHQRESEVFQRVHDAIDHHSSLLVQDLKRDAEDSCDFLNKFASKWNLHCERLQLIRKIFMFLDRTFVIQNRSIKSLWDLGLQTFARYFEQEKDVIEVKVISDFLECLENDRKGDPVDSDLLKVFTVMFKQLNIADHLEKPILDSTRVFYHSEALSLFQNSSSISNYLKRVCDRISEEENRSNSYISPSTLPFIVNLIHGEMIRNHIAELTGANLLELFASNSVEDLKRLYSLLNSVESLDSLKVALANSVLIEGRSIVQDTANDKILIKRLLDIQSKYSIILSEAFLSKAEFNNATKENFRKFINERANKPAELLAKYIDELLRSGDKTSSDAGLEATFTSLMMLFKHIDDKDVFEAFYKKDLAKRLLLNKSASSEAELSMISMLRQECGQNFTHKLEGMFTDISVSEELNARFQLFLKSGSLTSQIDTSLEFEPQVLTISHWPTVKESSLFAPPEVKAYQMLFEKFYHSLDKNSGRKLQWDYAMSFAVLSGDFPKGRKELVVSAYQAAILLQFNSSKTISFSDLLKSTMMEKNELERNLDSLLSTPRILQKKPKEKDFKETDMLRVNPDFESRLYRVKVNAVQIEETTEEQKATTEKVFADRQYQLDACIVRIMKSRKKLTHSQLVSEVLSQSSRFQVTVAEIKKQISSLIERDYMERDSLDSSTYLYIA